MRLVLAALLVFYLIGCTNEYSARSALEGAGYTNIHMTGFRLFGCGEEDTYRDGFIAKGPSGKTVTGVVCSGVMKGATIRLD